MGRITKRNSNNKKVPISSKKLYKAGIYARLSGNGDEEKSESIDVQVEMVKKYIEAFNGNASDERIEIVQCYTDLGKTGTNFERTGFLKLMQDIRLGDINCVVVKDLSRFGRDYLEAGNYIEKIFPFLGVRFIAVTDGYDTGKAGNENKQISSEIKNLVNDMYAKDFSKKAKIQLKQRREEGSYVGGPPPYGYLVEKRGNIRTLIPDENAAEIVKYIFNKFIDTESYMDVTRELNIRKVNPPTVYRKTQEVFFSGNIEEYSGWDKTNVTRILNSKTYAGTLEQGKTSITARNEKTRKHKPESEWIIKENAHQAIIAPEIYQQAANIIEKIKKKSSSHKHPSEGCPIGENIFESVLYCGVCGKKMTRGSQVKICAGGEKVRNDRYFCIMGEKNGLVEQHESLFISKAKLLEIIIPLIRFEFKLFFDKPEKYIEFGKAQIKEDLEHANKLLQNTARRIYKYQQEENDKYLDYRMGKVTQKEYVEYKLQKEECLLALRKTEEEQKNRIREIEKVSSRYLASIKALLKLRDGCDLTKEMVEAFISKIYVYPENRLEVLFTFTVDYLHEVKQ